MKNLSLIILCSFLLLFGINATAQWNPSFGWLDSYQANGLCWCESNYDHNLNSKTVTINGSPYSVPDICDELQYHPLYRVRQTGDPVYNDIQCGNGPYNDAADEPGCPGRVDLGSDGCSELGGFWDMNWLESRTRFGGNGCNVFHLPYQIEAEDYCNQLGLQVEGTTDTGGGQNLGHIHNNDWVEFAIYIPASSTYTFEFRVASSTSGGQIVTTLNSNSVGSITVTNTGGWQSWETKTQNLQLSSGTHTLRLTFTGGNGGLMNLNWLNIYSTDVIIQSKVLLNGAWNNPIMTTSLNTMLPTTDPYGLGETTNGIPNQAVDWVKVELRSNTNAILSERACFVRNDGVLLDLDGTEGVRFSGLNVTEAYIVIRHRNHLGVMSGAKVTF